MDAAHMKEESETQQMLSPGNYLDKNRNPAVDFEQVPSELGPNAIRRFHKEMWRDGKGTGCICYYTLFDV